MLGGTSSMFDITDIHLNASLCTSRPYYGSGYPSGATFGSPHIPDPDAFDAKTFEEKASIFQAVITDPWYVDIDKLTDEEINSLCLTVEDCRTPPLLTILRKVSDDSIWTPSVSTGNSRYKDMTGSYCCDINDAVDGFEYDIRNSNMLTARRMYPAVNDQYRYNANFKSVKFYPSGTDGTNSKLARVEVNIENTNLYYYVDTTCNHQHDNYMANGFLGNQGRLGGGIFLEVIFKTGNSDLPSTHGPMTQKLGPIPTTNEGKSFNVQVLGNLVNGNWVYAAVKNVWITESLSVSNGANKRASYAKMAGAHLKTALEWLMLSPPQGNLPVAIMYVYGAWIYLNERPNPPEPTFSPSAIDFSLIEEWQDEFYYFMQGPLQVLLEITPGTEGTNNEMAKIFTAFIEEKDECLGSMTSEFVTQFSSQNSGKRKPPEQGCLGASPLTSKMDCQKWSSSRCQKTISVLYEARNLVWKEFHSKTPQCSTCPGLIGWWRSGTVDNKYQKLNEIGRFPQCLPFIDNDGQAKNDLGFPYGQEGSAEFYEIDYTKGITCTPDACRYTDADIAPLSTTTVAFEHRTCQSNSPDTTSNKDTLDACKLNCFTADDMSCKRFSYSVSTKQCKTWAECDVIGKTGALSDEVMYVGRPALESRNYEWDEAPLVTDVDGTPNPTNYPSVAPTPLPTKTPTANPTVEGETPSPTQTPTSEPTVPGATNAPTDATTTPQPTSTTTSPPSGTTTQQPTSDAPTSPTSNFFTNKSTSWYLGVLGGGGLGLIVIICLVTGCLYSFIIKNRRSGRVANSSFMQVPSNPPVKVTSQAI